MGIVLSRVRALNVSLQFATEGKAKSTTETQPLEAINDVFDRLKRGQVNGRVVLKLEAA